MEKGLGLSSIGIKTEERKDYEILQQSIPPETFKILQPFYGEKKGSKVYYSNMPIIRASYGRRPAWLRGLKENATLLESGSKEEILVNNILDKSFMEDFDSYVLDQFVLRDYFREIKAHINYDIFRKIDNN